MVPPESATAVAQMKQAGATTINLPDTVGYTTPDEYKALFQRMKREVPVAW